MNRIRKFNKVYKPSVLVRDHENLIFQTVQD